MDKYYLKNSMEEVILGNRYINREYYTENNVTYDNKIYFTPTKENLKSLIEKGIVVKNKDFHYFVNKVKNKLNIKDIKEAVSLFELMDKISPLAMLSLVLKEISQEFDNIYNKSINAIFDEEVFCINTLNGDVRALSVYEIKNIKALSLFRYKEDAAKAREIIMPMLQEIYGK